METIVLSLGGSLIMPESIDINFLKKFKQIIDDFIDTGSRVAIVCGGGMICRTYQKAAKELCKTTPEDLDWIGIKATKLNAELVRVMFEKYAHEIVIDDPKQPVITDKKIIIGSGHVPGSSSDLDAVLLAINLCAKKVINLTNIDYIYDKDPRKHEDAKPFKKIEWQEFIELIGKEWEPGKNVPFDPIAARECQIRNIKVVILNGKHLENLSKCLYGREFMGTVIN